jgi:hypothetical protein
VALIRAVDLQGQTLDGPDLDGFANLCPLFGMGPPDLAAELDLTRGSKSRNHLGGAAPAPAIGSDPTRPQPSQRLS